MVQTKAFLFSASIGPDKALSSALPLCHWLAICYVPLGSVPAIIVLAICILTLKVEMVCFSESWYSLARQFVQETERPESDLKW